jgi:hypothetical protein
MLTIALLIVAALVILALIGWVLYEMADAGFFEWLFFLQPVLNALIQLLGAVIVALLKALDNR